MVKMITIVLVGSLLLHLTVIESFLPWNPGSFRFISHSDSGIAGSFSILTASISPLTSSDIIQAARSSLPNPTNSDILQEIKNSITVSDPKLSVQQETLKVALTRIANALSRANVDPNLLDSMISEANQPLSIIGNINTLNLTSEHLYYYLAAIAIDALQPKPLMKVTQKKTAVHILFGLSSSGKTTIAAQLASWMIQNNYGKRILVLLNDVKDIPTFEKLKKTFGGGTLIEYLLPETAKAVTPGSLQLSLLKNTLTPFYQKAIAKATSERYDAVLIDLPSESYLDRFYLDNVKALKSSLNADELLLVLDAEKVQQSTYLAVRSSENGVDTTGCIISNLNKNTNTGLVFNMNDIFSSLSLKFESRGNDMNDFTPFNAKEYIFNVFDINPSIFQDLAERAELFGSKLKLTPEVFQDLRIAGKFFSREDAVMTQFFYKSMQIYELLTEEERNDPYSFIEIFGTDPNLEKKEKLWKQIASRKAGFSKTSIYCLGLFMREFWFMIYDLFEPVREIAGVESKFPGRSPAKDKAAAPSAGKGFGSKSKTQEQADSPYGFDIKGKINRLPKDISSFFPTNEMLKQRGLLEILNNFPTSNP